MSKPELFDSDAHSAEQALIAKGQGMIRLMDKYRRIPRVALYRYIYGLKGCEQNRQDMLWKFGSIQFICIFSSV